MTLITTIESIADRIQNNRYHNEADVREAIVNRILQELGWDIYDPSKVRREYSVDRRRVDYALFTSATSPVVFIEVKAPNAGEEGDRQLFEYAFHEGIPFAVLVNGRDWSFYLPAEQGNYAERRVQKLDLLERKPQDSASIFERYLRFDRVRDGAAHKDARSDYRSAAREREAEIAIPRAWQELLTQPDELLIELIAEKVAGLIGFRPTDEQIETFLLRFGSGRNATPLALSRVSPLGPSSAGELSSAHQTSSTRRTRAAPIQELDQVPPEQPSPRRLSFRLRGQVVTQPDAISTLIFLLKKLSEENPNFLTNFARQAPGRTRNHISRNRSQVYPGKPELEEYTTEISPGWWLGTNLANREKERLVKIACDVAGLQFGREVVIQFPNTAD